MNDHLLLQGVYPFELPPLPADEKEILYHDLKKEDQYWRRPGAPVGWHDMKPGPQQKWIEEETRRCFDTGKWVFIQGTPYWLPPSFWFTLNWWKMVDGYLDFRYNQLLEDYFENFCENDPWCISTFRYKKRRDGLTSRRMARKVWKAIQTKGGWFGIQSKTGTDAKKVCWKILMTGFKKIPTIFLPHMSGNTDPKTMLEFKKPSTRITRTNQADVFGDIFRQDDDEDDDLNTTIDYRDTVSDAYDGQQCAEITLDEFAKWRKASASDALYTYIKSVTLDGRKVGMIHNITSPAEKDDTAHKESLEIWDVADYTAIKDVQAWKIYRWFTSSLDSYAGAINKYGFCNRDLAYKMVMAERDAATERKRKAVIRQTPMYIDEIIEAADSIVFSGSADIKRRKRELEKMSYKDPSTKEPKYIYGNLEWKDGIQDTEVYFKISDSQEDYSFSGRFCFSYMPEPGTGNRITETFKGGKLLFAPPSDAENTLGIDPYDFKRTDSPHPSRGAAVCGKTFDFHERGNLNRLYFMYNYRPSDPKVFYEDMIKGAVFTGAMVNTESRNMKIVDHFEERGYFDWLLAKNVMDKKKKDIKGSPTTAPLIQEICTLIEDFIATYLREIWWEDMCDDLLNFDPDNTKKSNITMALGHMLLGMAKRRRYLRLKHKVVNQLVAAQGYNAVLESFF